MAYTPVILTGGTADYDEIRGYLGVELGANSVDIPDTVIASEAILGEAEQIISYYVALQAANGVPTVAQIMAGTSPATAADKVFLRNAVKFYAAKLLCASLTNALNVSITTGAQTQDRGP